jgi:hypothetical protein
MIYCDTVSHIVPPHAARHILNYLVASVDLIASHLSSLVLAFGHFKQSSKCCTHLIALSIAHTIVYNVGTYGTLSAPAEPKPTRFGPDPIPMVPTNSEAGSGNTLLQVLQQLAASDSTTSTKSSSKKSSKLSTAAQCLQQLQKLNITEQNVAKVRVFWTSLLTAVQHHSCLRVVSKVGAMCTVRQCFCGSLL